ncbi:MAG: ABC transporter permease subunit [Planctomycetota bacterium]|nr:ABC transporter permease subunit [Planctomycetota bacterium]MDA0932232.1 ABC transporter permease subunit [Planctomycetota bacterium]
MSEPRRSPEHVAHARRRVLLQDVAARAVVTVGGLGTIAAVSGVFLFLVVVVWDLFLPARIGEREALANPRAAIDARIVGTDEYVGILWHIDEDGVVRALAIDDGAPLSAVALGAEGVASTAAVSEPGGTACAIAFADGQVVVGEVGFATSFREVGDVDQSLRSLGVGERRAVDGELVERTVRGGFRLQRLDFRERSSVRFFADGHPVIALHRAARGADVVVAAIGQDGRVGVRRLRRDEDPLTGDVVMEWSPVAAIAVGRSASGSPRFVRLTDRGTNLAVAWADGTLERWSLRRLDAAELAETADLVPGNGELTALEVLLGGVTLISGTAAGDVAGWFVVPDDASPDGFRLTLGHAFPAEEGAAVRVLASSGRERIFLVGDSGGHVRALHMTSEKVLARVVSQGGELRALALSPPTDRVIAAGSDAIETWSFDPRHPEVSLTSLFLPVAYERYPEPAFVWQSSSGTDEFEPKLSLVPLVFGTIKATLFAMWMAVPLALLAALFTSEFLGARQKARLKPLVELMASLPSVVLGFLAAVVIAPAAQDAFPALLACVWTVPVTVVLAAQVFQSAPPAFVAAHQGWRLPLALLAVAVGTCLGMVSGPAVEALLFAGDFRLWLDGGLGSGLGAWVVVLLPLCAVGVILGLQMRFRDRLDRLVARGQPGWLVHGCGTVVAAAVSIGVAVLVGFVVHGGLGTHGPVDLREGLPIGAFDLSPFGTFDQRNALVVGFVMGFALVPVIYTIAEDALSSVPDHLRAASLGAGASRWQTAVRVVVPAAASGLFSACMVGLGRAVGETMIVLMAAGNTPILSMNAFAGFRTLSANIATELPEAAPGSTHYRTLFLAALVLFAMTFAINTVAEAVRQRFRQRAVEL